jgi:AcrR family transcriptional regulator
VTDSRVTKTLKKLDGSFVELLHRRSYANIRVSDVTRKAGIGRATYYAHYSSKHDLLRSQFDRIVAPMVVARKNDPGLLDITPLLVHVKTSPQIFKALVGSPNGGSAGRILRECFEKRIGECLASIESAAPCRAVSRGIPKRLMVRFVASSLLAIVEWWVESGAREPVEQMQATFSKLICGGLSVDLSPNSQKS